MPSVFDVARYILDRLAPDPYGARVTAWKLQKLVYYCQAWSLVWDEEPIFEEEIQAWANGPVCPDLYARHRGRLNIFAGDINGDPSELDEDQVETVDAVLSYYGHRSGRWLSDLTHMERPWRRARRGVEDGEICQNVISHDSMLRYYEGLRPGG